MRPARASAWVLVCVALAGACGDDEAPPHGQIRDAAASDSGEARDAGDRDGASNAEALIVTANGDPDAPGTLDEPTTLTAALGRVEAGQAIYLRGGTYKLSEAIVIARENSGTAGAKKTLSQYRREAPILDFTAQSSGDAGIVLDANHWRIVGLIVRGAAGGGILVSGSHNRIERCVLHANRGHGLAIVGAPDSDRTDWPSDDQIINCESLDNHREDSEEDADGFVVRRAGPGNFFGGCVAHHNFGDGWDLSAEAGEAPSSIGIDQSVAHSSCNLTTGPLRQTGSCSGFRLGSAADAVAHVVTRSVAYLNQAFGFTAGGNPGKIRISNALAYDNQGNYAFESGEAVFTNDLSWFSWRMGTIDDVAAGEDVSGTNRFWREGSSGVSAADFARPIGMPFLMREQSGDLVLEPFRLAQDSTLIDAGVVPEGVLPFEASYYRGKPDLGSYETQ